MYGYIYKTTNLCNKKIYIGQHKAETFVGRKYLGSGVLLQAAIKKYGKENFKVELLESLDSQEDLNTREVYWIAYYKATNRNIGYNISIGGNGCRGEANLFYGKHHAIETKKIISEKNKAAWTPDKKARLSQKMHDIETAYSAQKKKQISEAHHNAQARELNGMFGKTHSDETKQLISSKRKQFLSNLQSDWVDPAQTAEARNKRKISLKGHTVSEETRQKLREFNLSHC